VKYATEMLFLLLLICCGEYHLYNDACATQLVMYLIENKMSSLSGRPQKIVVNILEEIVNQGTVHTCAATDVYCVI